MPGRTDQIVTIVGTRHATAICWSAYYSSDGSETFQCESVLTEGQFFKRTLIVNRGRGGYVVGPRRH